MLSPCSAEDCHRSADAPRPQRAASGGKLESTARSLALRTCAPTVRESSSAFCPRFRRRGPFGQNRVGDHLRQLGFFREGFLGGVLALADQLAVELEPGALHLDNAAVDADVENAALLVDALVEHDVELGFTEGRGDLVLDDLHLDV